MAKTNQSKSDSGFVASTKVALKSLQFPEAWLERKIRDNPSVLGLGDITKVFFQRRYKKAGRVDLILVDKENSILYPTELMLNEVDESHLVRCIEYWLTEIRKPSNKDWSVIAVLAAEGIRESRFFPVIEFISQKMPLTVLELSALKVSGYTTLTFTKFFDGQDQLEQTEGGGENTGRIDVDRDYWTGKRSAEIIHIADNLVKIFRSPNKQLRATYLQQFWGFALGEKPANFVTISPKRGFVNVRARLQDTEAWSERLEKQGFDITGGTPRKSIRFRVTSDLVKKRGKVLRQLAADAYGQRFPTA